MRKGFTLIELTMVIIIIGILAGVAIPRYVNLVDQAKNGATQSALGALRSAIAIYYLNYAANNNGATVWPDDTAKIADSMSDGTVPKNAVNNLSDITFINNTTNTTSAAIGWYYDSVSGRIWAANNTNW